MTIPKVSTTHASPEEAEVKIANRSREELAERVAEIPEFELLRVFTKRHDILTKQEKFFGVVEKDKNDAIAIVSDRYSLVQMREIFGRVLTSLASYEGEIAGDVLYWRGRGQLQIFPKDSDVGMCVLNSVDASSAIKVYFVRKENGTTIYSPRVEGIGIEEFKRLHVGRPLSEVLNFSEILLDAQNAWGMIVERLSNTPLTDEIMQEVKESLDTKILVKAVDQFNHNLDRYIGNRPTLWNLLLAIMKTASASKFKTPIHREKRLCELSTLLIALALKMS